MNIVARAAKARSTSRDDIPVARRTSPKRRRTSKELILLLFLAISLGALLTTGIFRTSFGLFVKGDIPPLPLIGGRSVDDGRLLGHFSYPEASKEDLVTVYPGLRLHFDTYEALKSMRSAASYDGVNLVLLSGYRSHDLQEQIFFDIKSSRNQTASERARVSAPPGYSEHSTGYAIDLGDAYRRETDLTVEFESTKAFKWLQRNAARYHFIMSFPRGNIQGVSYEPWHWRYEGSADALLQFEDARRLTESS